MERGSGSQVGDSGPQCQARRPGVDAGTAAQLRGHWRNQLCSGKKGEKIQKETFATGFTKEMSCF